MELFELTIEEKMDEVFAISLVENPAIESDFMFFGKEVIQFAKADTEQRMLIGPVLIPDKRILRVDGEGKPYQVYLSKDTIKQVAQNYLMKKYTDKATLEHDKSIKGVHLVESWIKEGRLDKSNSYGLAGLPEGTWMGMFKITDDRLWNDYIKTGAVKGFSIEGLFSHKLIHTSKINIDKDIDDMTEEEAFLFLSTLRELIKENIQLESYADYGQSIRNNAKRGRELNEKNGNKCATQVGKVRSAQLEAGEAISLETLKRMYSFLSRAETYYDETDMNACGTISFLLWGGKAGLSYSRNKLRELGEIELKVGVPHYTKDGKLWEGPTHKDSEGRLMTGETHSEDSEYLYHREELEGNPSIPNSSYPGEIASGSISAATFAEVGPRGGIKESPKSPKGETPNPNPKGEGTAKGDASGKSAKVTPEQEKTLQGKVDDFNERESNTKNGRATLGQLKSVFQRGLGAFNVSHSPVVKSASQWAFARVNAYLYLLKNGSPESAKYTTDYDLLPKGHPKAS